MNFETDIWQAENGAGGLAAASGAPRAQGFVSVLLSWVWMWLSVRPEDPPARSLVAPAYYEHSNRSLKRRGRRMSLSGCPPSRSFGGFYYLLPKDLTRNQFLERFCRLSVNGRVRAYHMRVAGSRIVRQGLLKNFDHGRRRDPAAHLRRLMNGLWDAHNWPGWGPVCTPIYHKALHNFQRTAVGRPMFDVVIIGAGPAGVGLLSSLYRAQAGADLKVCLIESSDINGAGRLASYAIPSDTRAEKFLTCLDGLPERFLADPELAQLTKTLQTYGAKAVPLPVTGAFYRRLGVLICEEMTAQGQLELRDNTYAAGAEWLNNHWQVEVTGEPGNQLIKTRALVMACGAQEDPARFNRVLASYDLDISALTATCLSSEVLCAERFNPVFAPLQDKASPKVVVLGGSHSAISSAAKLLLQDIDFGLSGIRIFHRSPMHATFTDAKTAKAQGVHEFGDQDICPHTQRVFALKGFRLDSRDLLMAIKGYGDVPTEGRVELRSVLGTPRETVRAALLEADLVVSALGYRPNYIPLTRGVAGEAIGLNAPNYVDDTSRILDSELRPVPNCYALGLASNYNLAGRFGEPSFRGQANGLVLWHKDIGMEIASALLKE